MKIKYSETNGAGVDHKTGKITAPFLKPTKELIEFAEGFSENYLTQKADVYHSGKGGKGKYVIEYQKADSHPGKQNFSYGLTSGTFVFSKNELVKYSKNYVFFMVIWLGMFGEVFKLKQEYSDNLLIPKADNYALKYYLKTKRSKRDIMTGFIQTISKLGAINPLNTARLEWFTKELNKR
jgi:hypothetical protein